MERLDDDDDDDDDDDAEDGGIDERNARDCIGGNPRCVGN